MSCAMATYQLAIPARLGECRDSRHRQLDLSHPMVRGGVVRSDTETGLDRNERPQDPSGANLVKRRIGPNAIIACTDAMGQ